nr:sulfite exporter TauE/SafE family protein [Chloroflexia bacterium]
VLDVAEIPTFEMLRRYDVEGDGILSPDEKEAWFQEMLPQLEPYIELTVAGQRLPLRDVERSVEVLPGEQGLPVLRVEVLFEADLPADWEGADGFYSDRTYEGRPGWREIVARGGPGVVVTDSTVPETGVSDALRSYPVDSIDDPLYVTNATFRLGEGDGRIEDNFPGVVASRAGSIPGVGWLASVFSAERLTPGVLALALGASLLWGAAHALTPGHGKAIVAAYLIGTRGTARHAALLGLTVTLTHTAGVFALALVTLSLSRYFLPEELYPWLSVGSGVLVVAIGLTLLYGRTLGNRGAPPGATVHNHGGASHCHSIPTGDTVTTRSLLALGVSGGLVPCPSALVLLLGAISVGRLELGILLVLAFSVGLAGVLTGIGLLVVYARWLLRRFSFEPRAPRFLPAASAVIISIAGIALLVDSLGQTGVL